MPSERFDLVLAFDVLHDAADPAAVLAAARRALRAHGILLALEADGSDPLSRRRRWGRARSTGVGRPGPMSRSNTGIPTYTSPRASRYTT
ncbi:MAG: methyltransferase domain-containing protein [Dermatophilaceae bacterium]